MAAAAAHEEARFELLHGGDGAASGALAEEATTHRAFFDVGGLGGGTFGKSHG